MAVENGNKDGATIGQENTVEGGNNDGATISCHEKVVEGGNNDGGTVSCEEVVKGGDNDGGSLEETSFPEVMLALKPNFVLLECLMLLTVDLPVQDKERGESTNSGDINAFEPTPLLAD